MNPYMQAQWGMWPQQGWPQQGGYYQPQPYAAMYPQAYPQAVGAWDPSQINWREVLVGAAIGAVFAALLGRALR